MSDREIDNVENYIEYIRSKDILAQKAIWLKNLQDFLLIFAVSLVILLSAPELLGKIFGLFGVLFCLNIIVISTIELIRLRSTDFYLLIYCISAYFVICAIIIYFVFSVSLYLILIGIAPFILYSLISSIIYFTVKKIDSNKEFNDYGKDI